jgi:hypothetical protein
MQNSLPDEQFDSAKRDARWQHMKTGMKAGSGKPRSELLQNKSHSQQGTGGEAQKSKSELVKMK